MNVIFRLPKMPRNLMFKQNIIFPRARANIVNNKRNITFFAVGNDADMRQAAAVELPSNNVARAVFAVARCPALPREVNHQIGHAAVVNIGVGLF